jgi:two-component system chemotaxis sensor kinase CheA
LAKDIDMNKYSKLFVSESRESLRIMNDALLELEKNPENKELVDRIFRSAHTIKGMAGMMNFKAVVETAHAIEGVLGAIRDGRLQLKENVVETIFSGFDTLDAMVVAVEASAEIRENPKLIQQLRGLLSGAKEPATPKKKTPDIELEPVNPKTTTVSIRLGRRCSLPSARAMVILKELGKASEIVESNPTEADIDREHVFEELTIELEPTERFQEALRRVIAMSDVDEISVGMTGEPREKWNKMTKQEASAVAAPSDVLPAQTVKVGMDKLDDLLDNVGELVIGRSRLLEKASSHDDFELLEISTLIDKLTSDIQSKVLEIRMIPLDVVMSRFPRMVRDISKNEGKEVELLVEGGSIELDRTVVDRITEPMMHLLRNCIDHGIETTDERIHAGKKAKGLIRIVASKQQDHVLIEVSDDGRGIDYDQIRKTAVKKGVMSQGQADSASGMELLDLLFNPGFSTKSQVTEVSGRGVGLDVVKRAVEELGGSVMVSSSKGAGTTFSLWLPFTLAIIEAMLVGIADQTYAVAMGTIVESHKFEKDEVKTIRGREVVQLRGEVLPLIRMREFFGMTKSPETSEGMNTLVVQSRDRRVALRVDELIGHQQIVVKGLDRRLRKVRGISGGTILGSGRIALILDVDSIIGG